MKGATTPRPAKAARRRGRGVWIAALAVAAALVVIAMLPLTTRRGLDFAVSSRTIPAYAKALDFVDRDVNYSRLALSIVPRMADDETRMRTVLDWTRANIKPTPAGFPIVDDHPWYIIVRGYGEADQRADVFTTLLSYAEVPAYWIAIGPGPELIVSFALIGGEWRVIDVANGVVFQKDGRLATARDLELDHALAARQGPPEYAGRPYRDYFSRFAAPKAPDLTRPQEQMLIPRTWFIVKRLFGRGGQAWDMRPADRVQSGGRP